MTAAFSVNKRIIAKNTMYLYIRMGLVLGVNFYAVRLLLELLGVEDYGIYNVIFGFVLLFSVLNGALTSMMNRFLCHEMGAGGRGDADCLLFPNIESGNVFYKANSKLVPGVRQAGMLVGAKVPCVLSSRADSIESRDSRPHQPKAADQSI